MINISVNIRGIPVANATLRKASDPQVYSRGIMKWGKDLQRNLKLSISHRRFTGEIQDSIEWRQRPRGLNGELFMSIEGVYSDSAGKHIVSLNKNTIRNIRLAEWAIAHGVAEEKKGWVTTTKKHLPFLKVKGHPWIDRVTQKHIPKLPDYILQEVDKEIRR